MTKVGTYARGNRANVRIGLVQAKVSKPGILANRARAFAVFNDSIVKSLRKIEVANLLYRLAEMTLQEIMQVPTKHSVHKGETFHILLVLNFN